MKITPDMLKQMIRIAHSEGRRTSGSNPSELMGLVMVVAIFLMALSGGVTYYFTRKVYEHKVDPKILELVKDPAKALAIESELENLLAKEKRVKDEFNQLDAARDQAVAERNSAQEEYNSLKAKMMDEKIIHEEAFQDAVSNLKSTHAKELEEAKSEAHSDGVGTGVIGTLGVQMLLED